MTNPLKRSILMTAAAIFAVIFLAGCFQDPMSSGSDRKGGDVSLQLNMAVSSVTKLSKGNAITLNKMIVVFTSNGTPVDVVRDTILAGSGGLGSNASAQQIISKNYSLKALRAWKVVATVLDTRDSVIHRDSAQTPTLYVADQAQISLNLTSRYAMYEAKFLEIPATITSLTGSIEQDLKLNRLVLRIDGATVRDSSVAPGQFTAGLTHTLAYDYVPTGTRTALNSGTSIGLNAVRFPTATRGYAVGALGTIARTLDGGATWANLTVPTGKTLRAVYFLNADTGWAAGDSVVYRTTNGGASWTIHGSAPFVAATSLRGIYFKNATTGIAAASNGSTYTTTNGGATWTASTGITSVNTMDAFNDTVWVAGASGNVRRNANITGTSWTTYSTGAGVTLHGISAPSNSVVIAVGENGKVARTTNGGANWSVVTISGAPKLLAVKFLDVSVGFAVGENGVLYSTNDGGATWSQESSSTTQHLNGVAFFEGKGYLVGNAGTIIALSGPKFVEMLAYGPMGDWNAANPLFSGSKYVYSAAGLDATVGLTLNWVGPTTGTGSISATLGRVGKVTINGYLPGTPMP